MLICIFSYLSNSIMIYTWVERLLFKNRFNKFYLTVFKTRQMFAIPSTNVSFFYWSSMAAWNICCMILGMSSVLRQTKVLPDGKVFFRRVAWSPRAPMNMQKTLTFRSVLSMIWEKRVGLRPCKLNNMS